MVESKFSWQPFYNELAHKVLTYKDDRESLVNLLENIYSDLGMKNPLKSNKREDNMIDVDPFTMLAFANRGITETNKIRLLELFKKHFGLENDIPVGFSGIPVMNNMKCWFFTYDAGSKKNGTNEIDLLWDLFETALLYSDGKENKQNLINVLNQVYKLPQIKWNITIGLFWYFPHTFVSLDGNTRNLLEKSRVIDKNQLNKLIDSAQDYVNVCETLIGKIKEINPQITNFGELSELAYEASLDSMVELSGENYYLISALPGDFAFSNLKIGDTENFSYKNEKGNDRAVPRNFKNCKPGDKVICYDCRPTKQAIGIGEIVENKEGEFIKIIKLSDFSSPVDYEDIVSIPEMLDSEYLKITRGTLFRLTRRQYEAINDLGNWNSERKKKPNKLIKGYNKIYFGLPGCGKSHKINNLVKNEVYFRTIFYQDYSYSDFVGQILPSIETDRNGNKTIAYKFNSGPFTDALAKAYENPDINVYLVIEEINRGNAPSIFGELFQLLDRVSEGENAGESEYPVSSNLIAEYLGEILPQKYQGKLFLPKNLIILASMNTSDQNVFTLDTAFKRRWQFEEVKNVFVDHPYFNKFVPNSSVTWERFVNVLNDRIVASLTEISSLEDKRIGSYFVTSDELCSEPNHKGEAVKKFAYKVFEYLWDDVSRFDRKQFFKPKYNTLSEIIEDFIGSEGLNVFDDLIKFND